MANNSGIYSLTHVETGKSYVGASINLKRRSFLHFRSLYLKKHYCDKMQADYDASASGNSAFEFRVVELCELEQLAEREAHHMEIINPAYNSNAAGGGVRPAVTDEFREKMRKRTTGTQLRYTGDYVTPFGTFPSSYRAAAAIDGFMSQSNVHKACVHSETKISRHTYGASKYLQQIGETVIGSDWKSLGFSFIAKTSN
ncbi:GIY-YIG nuclease family protein [Ensifer sesbaniae]|uniref:GIY-YIG nuclease family protein n=1 Tax=Ensifer sesbaniae TaxID=1214071 RepID=UPI002001383D|nr:GIY-YIG nuclease family protein [Ensifer sesbaniae]